MRAKDIKPSPQFIQDLPAYLRGASNNRFGGHQSKHMRALKGSKLGAANEGRRLGDEERLRIEERMRREGRL